MESQETKRLCVREKEACAMLGIGRALLTREIPHHYIGRVKLYRLSDIEGYLESHKKGAAR